MSGLIQDIIIENHKLYFRDFPWRSKHDPYMILIAEFMLQRTKAHQAAPVYLEFIRRYPDVETLSSASYNILSTLTGHLGLHWRSSHFIDAAKYIVNNLNGKIPKCRKILSKIPGVGEYTAGAILTLCFNLPEHVIDSNIARFINRIYNLGLSGEIRRKRVVKEKAVELFNYKHTRNFLFSLLDFTALVCKLNRPYCGICVVKEFCGYFDQTPSISAAANISG